MVNEFKPTPARKPLREPLRDAHARAAEVRANNGGDMDSGTDTFYVDQSAIPEGWGYEWRRLTVYGKEDPSYQVKLAQQGWEPVPASRHPEMMPLGTTDKFITREGQILMERPLELIEEAKLIERRKARDQVRVKEEQLNAPPPGQFERSNKDSSLVKVKKSYTPMPVPE
jgi:hypothetical protein